MQIVLQKHLADIMLAPAQSRRNCACFTPEGVYYTQQAHQQHAQTSSGHHVFGRNRRSVTSRHGDTAVPPEIAHLLRLSRAIDWADERLRAAANADTGSGQRRNKRDATAATIDHIGTVIQEIQESLGQLETSFVEQHELAISAADAAAAAATATGARCFIAPAGQVNCSEIVYADEKSWRKSRLQIDQLIQLLKTKIVNLKEMRKHLREHRPSAVDDGLSTADELDALEATTSTSTAALVPGRLPAHHRRPISSGGASRITKLELVNPVTAAELNAFGKPAAGHNEVPMVDDMVGQFRVSLNSSADELKTSSTTAAPHIRVHHHRQRNHNRTGQATHRRRQPALVETPSTTSTTTTTTSTPVPIAAQSVEDHLPSLYATQLLAEMLANSTASAQSPPATDGPPLDATTRLSNEVPQLNPLAGAPVGLPSNPFAPSHCFCAEDSLR